MSQVSQPQEEQITQHPLEAVVEQLDSLLDKLRIPAQTHPKSSHVIEQGTQEPTEEELEFLNSVEWISEGEIGEDIDVDAMNKRLKERGYQIQLSFPETPED
jgi:hypothetical protein